MTRLELMLLGTPQIYVDGQAITAFNTRKDCALLIYLAVTGTTHSRETLAGLLWPELPEAMARRNLRHSLSHLQRVIGLHWLETEQGVALTQHYPWSVDVHTLRTTVKRVVLQTTGQLAPTGSLTVKAEREALQQGLGLYRGEFLQGFHLNKAVYFEEWMLAQREESRWLALQGLEAFVAQCLTQGAYDQGLVATQRLLQLEPWSEAGHSLHMRLLVQSGRRAEALAQYERCRKILATELGVEPLPTTTALYQQIRAGLYPLPGALTQPAGPVASALAPPLVAAAVPVKPVMPNNLFTPLAVFIGRQTELDFISQRLKAADDRLLTIVGPGGMGKTALALAAGQRLLQAQPTNFPDGIFWVPLADLETAGQVSAAQSLTEDAVSDEAILRAIATQIGYKLAGGISSTDQLQNYLQARRLLLILDNFEHLLASAHTIVTLLTKAPQIKALVTSRARLNIRGESVLTLDKLSLPTVAYRTADAAAQANPTCPIQAEVWQTSEAVTMFVQRAQQVDPAFAINGETIGPVGEICRLVEGLPLGIELAASMLPLLSCRALSEAIARSLNFLATDMHDLPSDQRNLGAVFERSWLLLPPEGQRLLARLSIFPGTFHRDAAEQITGASIPMLQRLLNQSLMNKVGEDRYTLHRTVHAFAEQKLKQWPEQVEALQIQYAHFYLDFLARLERGLTGPAYMVTTQQIQAELDNVRMAWRWAVIHGMVTELNRCLDALYLFYEQQRFYLAAIELYDEALHHFSLRQEYRRNVTNAEISLLIGRLQTHFGLWYARIGQFQQAQATYESSWSILQRLDNPAASLCLGLWGALLKGSNPKRSETLLLEAERLIPQNNEGWMPALVYQMLGEIRLLLGDYAEAAAQLTKGFALAKQMEWPRGLTSAHKSLGLVNLAVGHYRQAEAHLREGISLARQHRLHILGLESILGLGQALRLQLQLAEAKACFEECRKVVEALGGGLLMAPVLWEEGRLAEQQGEYGAAKTLFRESLAIGHAPWWSHTLPTLGWALIGLNELDEAQGYFQQRVADAEAQGYIPASLDAQVGLAYIQVMRARQCNQVNQTLLAACRQVLADVCCHPAATAEMHQRIDQIGATVGGGCQKRPGLG